MSIAINVFNSLKTDKSRDLRESNSYTDALNVRVIQKGGVNYALTNLKGMKIEFQVSQGFELLGYGEYSDVLYMFFLNEDSNKLELGTFPSIKNGEWAKEYSTIKNYTGSFNYNSTPNVPDSLIKNTVLDNSVLGYSLDNRVEVLCKQSYDGSVNMIVCDGENPNRVFNSGFHHLTGARLPRYINDVDLQKGTIDQFNESSELANIKLHKIENGGKLIGGGYHFYIRYVNSAKSPTSFFSKSQMIPIIESTEIGAFASASVKGSDGSETNKSVILNLSNLDVSYASYEIGVLINSNGIYSSYVIDREYSINGLSSQQVKITGLESKVIIPIDSFLSFKPYTKACKTQTDLNSRWYGANWKGKVRHDKSLISYAKSIVLKEESKFVGIDNYQSYIDANGNVSSSNAYLNPENYETGYFSGETYMFLIHPIFKDGQIGLGYPMTGSDNYFGDYRNPNELGIFRFSSQEVSPNIQNGALIGKFLRIDFPIPNQWVLSNVSGWYISRAKRKENLKYQGYGCHVYDGNINIRYELYINPDFEERSAGFDSRTLAEDKFMPLIEPSSYYASRLGKDALITGNQTQRSFAYGRINYKETGRQHNAAQNRYAVFSTDYYIDKFVGNSVPKVGYVKPIAQLNIGKQGRKTKKSAVTWYDGFNSEFNPSVDLTAYYENGRSALSVNSEKVDMYNIDSWSEILNNKFMSKVGEGSESPNANGWYYMENYDGNAKNDFVVNLPMRVPAYIGIDNCSVDIDRNIVNVYESDPLSIDITLYYDPNKELVYSCSDFISVGKPMHIVGCGDCVVQRVFLKALHGSENWSDFLIKDIISKGDAGLNMGKGEADGYGHILSYIAECKHNSLFRYSKGINKFYPAFSYDDIGEFSFAYDEPESNFYNLGYNDFVEPRQLKSYDKYGYYGDEHYETRIMYSNVQLEQGIEDNYRQVPSAQLVDFDRKFGEINRVVSHQNSLISFQRNAINIHPIQERVYAPATDNSETILGVTNILSDYVQRISEVYGTQHQWSVIKGATGIFCVDAKKSAIIRVQEGVEVISLTKEISSLVEDIIIEGIGNINRYNEYEDKTLRGIGVHAGYDLYNSEVLFTFLFQNISKTICFSEILNYFTSRYSFTPPAYLMLNTDIFSIKDSVGFIHNKSNDYNSFYGQRIFSSVRFTVNKDYHMNKSYHSYVINCNPITFEKTLFETLNQKAQMIWETAPRWYKPKRDRNQWFSPIPRADEQTGDLNQYRIDSVMEGPEIAIELFHFENKEMELIEVLTNYELSL